MKNLVIIGARGYGREIYNLALKCREHGNAWVVKGFLDDKASALDGFANYPPILDSVENYVPVAGDVFICALGSVHYKRKYVAMINEKGGVFISLVHPDANVGINVVKGHGVIIGSHCFISNDVTLGNFVTIQPNVVIGHDVEISDWCHINPLTFVGGFCKIREAATVNAGAKLSDRITIGAESIVGIGSVVIRNVKPGTTVFGSPAREI